MASKKITMKKETLKAEGAVAVAKTPRATKTATKRPSADVYDTKGKVVGSVELPQVFGAKVNKTLMAQAVRVYLANQRKGTAKTQTRGDVRISTRKIYRQKGTGGARHGAKSAPIFVGGGVAHGPKLRDYTLALPAKMRKAALASALTTRFADGRVRIVDGLASVAPKTKDMHSVLVSLVGADKKKLNRRVMLVVNEKNETISRAARNLESVVVRNVKTLNTYEVLHNYMLVVMKESLESMGR